MRFFRGNNEEQRLITCPSCCQLIAADAADCEMCGADLRELPAEKREAALDGRSIASSGNPYRR